MSPTLIIIYSDHALQRMRQRGFTRQDVRTILAIGIEERTGVAYSRRAYLGDREAKVIYLYLHPDGRTVTVVTVLWTDEKPRHERVSHQGES